VNTDKLSKIPDFEGTTISIIQNDKSENHLKDLDSDFIIKTYLNLGSILIVNNETNNHYISKIQHVRRRETIAMTPINCHLILKSLVNNSNLSLSNVDQINKTTVQGLISNITKTKSKPIVGSSGLSTQYAIMMGLIEDAKENYREKTIKFIVPPNCYGGTNDQARRVADCIKNVEIVDLPVDKNSDMVKSIDTILDTIAYEDAVPYIIAEIPTNPRVEVPDLQSLKTVLEKKRTTASGTKANDAVFILDQTFCPNVQFFGDDEVLSSVRAISYASGSKFPSGGLCTAGYCVGNEMTISLLSKIEKHLLLCDNEATAEQYKILANQLPSMNNRIDEAYQNTRDFVNFISKTLPGAKINFVTDDLASLSFKPSVFSLDLPTKGVTDEEREIYKRKLNLRLINLMISQIPNESNFCVSYGQLKGSYWTIPATSTQGTTKEGDKDYIVRVSIAPSINIELHKKVFMEFVAEI
jgi:cystathionine beta-lyase/cystathionine gamma-synthase